MSIILLRGFSHSGKDFVGQILCTKYNYTRFAFADSLKKIVAKDFNCPLEQLHSQTGKLQICETDSLKRTYRQILIDEALRLRTIDIDTFTKHCCNEIIISNTGNSCNKIVITDWRYPNEITVLKESFPNYKISAVHIQRENQLESPVNDISEYQLLNRVGDCTIINKMNETIYEDVQKLIDSL